MFSTRLENVFPFSSILKLSSANSFSLEESKICRLGGLDLFDSEKMLFSKLVPVLYDMIDQKPIFADM